MLPEKLTESFLDRRYFFQICIYLVSSVLPVPLPVLSIGNWKFRTWELLFLGFCLLKLSFPGTFVPGTFQNSQGRKFYIWNFRFQERKFSGTKVPWILSIHGLLLSKQNDVGKSKTDANIAQGNCFGVIGIFSCSDEHSGTSGSYCHPHNHAVAVINQQSYSVIYVKKTVQFIYSVRMTSWL